MKRIYLLSFCLIFVLAGCLNESSSKKELDYDQTKKMVVDILQTDEGKKVLREIITDDKMKQHLIMDSDTVQQSMTKILDTKASTSMWQRLFEDPEFVKTYQESMEDEQKELFKSLMYDATFQKQLLDVLQNPEMTNQTLAVLKSQQFRKHLEETIQETLETPLFQSKIQHLLLEAAEKTQEENEKEDNKEEEKEEKEETKEEKSEGESGPDEEEEMEKEEEQEKEDNE